jgi:hypothetical protein
MPCFFISFEALAFQHKSRRQQRFLVLRSKEINLMIVRMICRLFGHVYHYRDWERKRCMRCQQQSRNR